MSLQKHGVEQLRPDVRKCRSRVDRDLHVMRAIPIRHIGAAVKRAAIRKGDKHIVETRIGQRRSKPAERCLINAVAGVIELADLLTVETRLVERAAGNEAGANQRDAGIDGAWRCDENKNNETQRRQDCRPPMIHDALPLIVELSSTDEARYQPIINGG